MNIVRNLVLAISLAAALLAPTSMVLAKEPQVSARDQASLQAALKLGRDIYRYDQAAWHTTDAMVEDIANPQQAGIRGWVIEEVDDGLNVIYWSERDGAYYPVYSAIYDGRTVTSRTVHPAESEPLDAGLAAQVEARFAPTGHDFMRCSKQPFNSVVLPSGKESGSLYVYYLVPQPDLDTIPMGGNYRFEVLDGKVIGDRTFTKSCISLSGASPDGDSKLAAMTISHILDPIPTEIHVFAVYSARIPMYVITMDNKYLWEVGVADGEPSARVVREM